MKTKKAFTIIELLTVMSIIIILIGLLVPAINKVKQYSKQVRQTSQFHSIAVGLDMFQTERGDYPDSGETGSDGQPYCGAMKLAEAMVGQDLLGFNPKSKFRSDFKGVDGDDLYQMPGAAVISGQNRENRSLYVKTKTANAARLVPYLNINLGDYEPGIWTAAADVEPFDPLTFVLCDVYVKTLQSGHNLGMPILYYKANTAGRCNPNKINGSPIDVADRYYRHEDNDELIKLVSPVDGQTKMHPMASDYVMSEPDHPWPAQPESMYWRINDYTIPIEDGVPVNKDSYLLISAGYDGLYGTDDDVTNY